MTLTSHLKYTLLGIAFLLTMFVFFSFNFINAAHASAPSGLQATIATSSQPTVTTTASLIIATSSCSARIISTQASPIMLTFSDIQGAVPTGITGALQAASTTVVYDSGTYGCGAVRAYSFVSQTINVIDSR